MHLSTDHCYFNLKHRHVKHKETFMLELSKARFIRRISAVSNAIKAIDNEMICFIIYCLNCIRHGRNATYERGLRWFQSVPVHSREFVYVFCFDSCKMSQRMFPDF